MPRTPEYSTGRNSVGLQQGRGEGGGREEEEGGRERVDGHDLYCTLTKSPGESL